MSVNSSGEVNALEEAILLSALDGEIPLTAVDDLGAQGAEEPTKRKSLVLDAVRSLLSRGCIVLGRFDEGADQKSEWRDWTGTVDEQINRLAQAYAPETDDWESWGFQGWFALTPDGEKAAEALQAGERALHAKGEPGAGSPWARNRESSTPT